MKRLAALLVAALLPGACGGNGADLPAVVPQATAAQTEAATPVPSSAATPAPEATPSPTPAPKMVSTTCPEARDNAGLVYEYDRNEMRPHEAVDEFCGPVSVDFSAWITHETIDKLTDARFLFADSIAVEHDIDPAFEAAFLRVLCLSDDGNSDLAVFVNPAGTTVLPDSDPLYIDAKVAYRFNDGPVIEDYWQVESLELFVLYPEKYRAFVHALRGGGELIFRGWTTRYETVTMTFDLTGVEKDVEPILQECGY